MRFTSVCVLALLIASPCIAQNDPTACWDRIEGQDPVNTFFNKQLSDHWRQMLQQADGQLMAQVAGVYYGERPSPDGQYLNRQYRSYDANGLFQYRDQTCGNIAGIPCSENQGTGEWRAVNQGNGITYVMVRFSDLIRTDACTGEQIQLGGNGFTDAGGLFWQRVQ